MSTKGPIQIALELHTYDDEPSIGLIGELVETKVDDEEPTRKLRLGKNLSNEIFDKLNAFLRENIDVFSWRHEDMVGIHLVVMCHHLNINPEKKSIRHK